MSGHDSNSSTNNNNTDKNTMDNVLEFFKPDWNKYNDLMDKPFEEFTQGEQTFFRRMYLWEEMGWGTQCAECSEDY